MASHLFMHVLQAHQESKRGGCRGEEATRQHAVCHLLCRRYSCSAFRKRAELAVCCGIAPLYRRGHLRLDLQLLLHVSWQLPKHGRLQCVHALRKLSRLNSVGIGASVRFVPAVMTQKRRGVTAH